MKVNIIDGNRIVDKILAPDLVTAQQLHPGKQVATGEDGNIGWAWNDGFPSPDLLPIPQRRAELRKRKNRQFRRVRDRGVTAMIGGRPVRLATDSIGRESVRDLLQFLESQGGTLPIETRAGTVLQADLALAQSLFAAVQGHVAAAFKRDGELGAAIDAATTHEALDTINIMTGAIDGIGHWPRSALSP